MSSFKNFATGESDGRNSSEFFSIRHKIVRDNNVGSRIERVWSSDFNKCETREDYEKYISKYEKYESNKYVSQAKVRIKVLDHKEKVTAEQEEEARKTPETPVPPGTGGSGIPPRYNIMQTCVKGLVWILIIGGVGFYSYCQYEQQKQKEKQSTIVIPPYAPTNNNSDADHGNSINSEPENNVATESDETTYGYYDCNICHGLKYCQLCAGIGRCAECGGGGQVFSVFYGDEVGPGRMTDCGSCGGTGRCPSCDGSGLCFACEGRGVIEAEF